MPRYGYGGGYGGNYRQYQSDDEDPLASAINAAIGSFTAVRQAKKENARYNAETAAREASAKQHQANIDRDRQDKLDAETRDREAKKAEAMLSRGISMVPTATGSGGFGASFQKIGPSDAQAKIAAAIQQATMTDEAKFTATRGRDLADLQGTARVLGVPFEGKEYSELKALVDQAEATAKATRERTEFEGRKLFEEGLVRGRPKEAGQPSANARESFADTFVEAAGGNVQAAMAAAEQQRKGEAGRLGMTRADYFAAANRYKRRSAIDEKRAAPATSTGALLAEMLAETAPRGSTPAAPAAATATLPPLTAEEKDAAAKDPGFKAFLQSKGYRF